MAREDAETKSIVEAAATGPTRALLVLFCEGMTAVHDAPSEGSVMLGRAGDCELQVDHASVSRHHARIHAGRPLTLEDLGGRNGCRIRGVRIAANARAPIHPGDVVELGDALLVVRVVPEDAKRPRLGAREALEAAAEPTRSVTFGEEARWFSSQGARVQLGRRGPLRRVLLRLFEQRIEHPGVGLAVDALLEAGWPEEKMQWEAGVARVYTTVQRLRALGLHDVLITRDDGYLIDPGIEVKRS